MGAVIEVEGLTKRYGRQIGVEDLTFHVEAGEVFGYLGPNGAGKTTTIRTLMDLIRPTRGVATVLGLDSRRDSVAVKRRVGYLPGELALYDDLTGDHLLRAFANLRDGVRWDHVSALAQRLDADLHRRIRDLSTGNRRKIGLIQALMHRPELLLLDEPTAGLDPLVQHELYRILEEVRAEGATVFLSSHNLHEVERICDRVAIIREGRLVTIEDVGDLLARSFRELEIHFAGPVSPATFAGLPGVREVSSAGDVLRIHTEGRIDAVVKRAAQHTVVSITTREPSLEDVFLAYYGSDDAP